MGCFSSHAQPKIQRQSSLSADKPKRFEFISASNARLQHNGIDFRFASFNIPGLLLTEDRGGDWVTPTSSEQRDALLSVKGANGRVARTYTLGFGPNYHLHIAPNPISGQLEKTYNENVWIAFDNALAIARELRIRLIIPLINNHNGGDSTGPGNFGDYWTLCNYRNVKPSQFYSNKTCIQDVIDLIVFMLSRRNTVNGICYKDDATILCWQLGNELGGWDEAPPPSSWTLEIAAVFKKFAPNTLVADGTLGGLNLKYPEAVLESNLIDIFSNHYYWGLETDLPNIKKHANVIVKNYNKVFILGEFGFDYKTVEAIFAEASKNKLISGCLVWSLRYHSRDGGFYVHAEDPPEKGFFSFHVPGFPVAHGFSRDDARVSKMVRKYAIKMRGRKGQVAYPLPYPAQKAERPCTPQTLRWMGSAWAASYNVYRVEAGAKDSVFLANVVDGVATTPDIALYCDQSAVAGKQYTYLILPVGIEGDENTTNPLQITC